MATAAREVHTAEEIRDEVHRLIHEGKAVRDDGAEIGVPLPTPYAQGVREPEGSNWSMAVFTNAAPYEGWVLHCMKSVQARWDLAA
ncbi:hypothetical protein J2W35_003240 [Variovorax boronicumulans]|uniref:hypothetical protein n=1 Tax=Variovorax boronicumulans TaxID=436515 RepID=UPI002788ABDF|nr:hypothetical protein [Variovorax boronicumulans]MDQ0082881.1 hypothetical protein [Variovorax boronicumulans]